jgi:hypothetical protein
MNADGSMNSTDDGITIDRSDEDENANDSIRFNDDDCSNVIDSSELQCEKQEEQRISTDDEIRTESID